MRREPTGFAQRFEQEGPAILSFDRSLARKVYSVLRRAAFAYANAGHLRGRRWLDVACGSGHETADIWLWLGGDVEIVAVDPVPGLVELAEQRFDQLVAGARGSGSPPRQEESRPAFCCMDAMHLGFPDESFDVVFHSLLLHWTPDPARAVRELARVLRPGGLVLGTQIFKPMASPYMGLITRVHENVYGYFEREDLVRWYEHSGVRLSITTPAGIFKGYKCL
jgi:ubiquinone/menaquinone biosynthesis C-methylase UbiE